MAHLPLHVVAQSPDVGRVEWIVVALVWLLASFGSAAAIAWIQKRAYPALSFYKLWAFWTVVASFTVLILFLLGRL